MFFCFCFFLPLCDLLLTQGGAVVLSKVNFKLQGEMDDKKNKKQQPQNYSSCSKLKCYCCLFD